MSFVSAELVQTEKSHCRKLKILEKVCTNFTRTFLHVHIEQLLFSCLRQQ